MSIASEILDQLPTQVASVHVDKEAVVHGEPATEVVVTLLDGQVITATYTQQSKDGFGGVQFSSKKDVVGLTVAKVTAIIEGVAEESLLNKVVSAPGVGSPANSLMEDPDLGLIQVYREFKPSRDSVEYTTFFRRNGVKYRNDFELTTQQLEEAAVNNVGDVSNFVRDLIYADIQAGNFNSVTEAVR